MIASAATTAASPGRNVALRPSRTAAQTPVTPDRAREEQPCPQLCAVLPEQDAADAHERTDRGRERDRVVRMDDAGGEAEDQRRHGERSAPQEQRRSCSIGPPGARGHDEATDQQDQRRREQPRDLAAEVDVEETVPPGRAPHRAGRPGPADATGLVAGEASQSVVAEDQVEDAVVLRSADVRPVGCGRELDDRDPPSRRAAIITAAEIASWVRRLRSDTGATSR